MFVKFLHILQNPTADRYPLFWETFHSDLTGLTFDLGNECPSGCECLHGVQEWVSGDDLTHDSQSFTQALMGQWPAGFKEVCRAELAWVRRKRLAPAFPASQRSDGETEAGLDGVSPSKSINFTLSWTYTRREEASLPTGPADVDSEGKPLISGHAAFLGRILPGFVPSHLSNREPWDASVPGGQQSDLDAERDLTVSLCSSDQPPASASGTLGCHTTSPHLGG